jgi:hypothetical protein
MNGIKEGVEEYMEEMLKERLRLRDAGDHETHSTLLSWHFRFRKYKYKYLPSHTV